MVFQIQNSFKMMHPFSTHSQQEELAHKLVSIEEALRVKEGNLYFLKFQKHGLKL